MFIKTRKVKKVFNSITHKQTKTQIIHIKCQQSNSLYNNIELKYKIKHIFVVKLYTYKVTRSSCFDVFMKIIKSKFF